MNLYLKQKVFSVTDSFEVYDADEKTLYTVKGKFFSMDSKHTIHNAEGAELATITRKIISVGPKFYIEMAPDGRKYEMAGKLAVAHEVAVIEELGMEITGDITQHNYSITQNGNEIASVHQKWISWGDTYEIQVNDGIDEVLILAMVTCFDIMHQAEFNAFAGLAGGAAGK